jgi:hypothetical protein
MLPRIPVAISQQFNFFRIHLLVFTLTPLVLSGVFYAANGSSYGNANGTIDGSESGVRKVDYIDALFSCFSAMT